MSRFILLISVLFLFSCTSEKSGQKLDKEETTIPAPTDGTAQMVKLLREAHASIDPMKVGYHLNSVRAENYKLKLQQTTQLNQQLQGRGAYANELLQAGKTHEAILEIEVLLEELGKIQANPQFLNRVKQLLAISYMRLGEQENCLGKNNSESCILPIQGDGIYNLRKGPETAISIYESILKENPDDLETLWLLNIAYMTLGEYPKGVPAKWRIPEKSFRSSGKVAPFKNISNQLKLATVALAGGVCIEDFNKDGFLDIIASSWGINDQVQVFFNQGDGTFKDVTSDTGLQGITGGLNMIHADYNNDGFSDVLVLRGGWYMGEGKIPNSLLRNNGDGSFTDVTIESGLLSKFPTQTATWNDFNNDGWVDLFIGNESGSAIDAPCELFINEEGHFTNHTVTAGLGNVRGVVKGVCSGDINNDGFADIYLSIMGQNNVLMLNNKTSGSEVIPTFKDITEHAGVQYPVTSFPTWMFDFNQDGLLDIFAGSYDLANPDVAATMAKHFIEGNYNPSKVHLYKNMGEGRFEEVAQKMGINEPAYVMGSNFGDIDNDGALDFYLGTGAPRFTAVVPNKMYRGNGKRFEDVTSIARLGHVQKGHAVSFGDFDNDGDQDIFHVLGGAYEGDIFKDAFFENTSDKKNNWITILLKGTKANKSAIGARIKLDCSDEKGRKYSFFHTVSTGGSFGSSSLQQEIGIGKATKIDKLMIMWPNAARSVEVFNNIIPNRFVEIEEGVGEVVYLERKAFEF